MNAGNFESDYAEVNGLKMYYEIHGAGKPLVLIHGGGSSIDTSFGNITPLLAKHRQIIAVDMQAHGRTSDRPGDLQFKQDADDIVTLLQHLKIPKADFLGFSNGGQTLIELSLRHPAIIRKLIIASAFYARSATAPQFWEGFDRATIDHMPPPLKDAFFKVNNSEQAYMNMFNKDVQRMKAFKGWTDEQIQSIKAPTLIINSTHDVGSVEHAVQMHRMIDGSQLFILPGNHGDYMGAIEYMRDGKWKQVYVADIVGQFLDES